MAEEILGETVPDHSFRMRRGARPDLGGVITHRVARPRPAPRPAFWWIPGRSPDPVGSETTVEEFRAKLETISELLAVAWDWDLQRWVIWVMNPRVKVPYCRGWWRLFTVERDEEYYPLNEIALATIYERDMSLRHNENAVGYHDRMVAMVESQKERKKQNVRDDDAAIAAEVYDYQQVKVSAKGLYWSGPMVAWCSNKIHGRIILNAGGYAYRASERNFKRYHAELKAKIKEDQ